MPESGEAGQKILVRPAASRGEVVQVEPSAAWRWVGWLGLLLVIIGVVDMALAWYPTAFGTPEWEFATVAQTVQGLPIVTMGMAGLLGAGFALGSRWVLVAVSVALLGLGILIGLALLLFLTDVPMALRATTGIAATGVKKAIVRTIVMGVVFGAGYLAAGVAAIRHLRSSGGTRA